MVSWVVTNGSRMESSLIWVSLKEEPEAQTWVEVMVKLWDNPSKQREIRIVTLKTRKRKHFSTDSHAPTQPEETLWGYYLACTLGLCLSVAEGLHSFR